MRKTADYPCEQPSYSASGQSKKRAGVAKEENVPAAASAIPKRLPRKPNRNHQVVGGSRKKGQAASPKKDAGPSSALNPMETIPKPSGNEVNPLTKDNRATQPNVGERTPTQMAVFPEASKQEWSTLLCTVSGQKLIQQTDALIRRREILLEMAVRISFGPDALDKTDELDAAAKEMQAIDGELSKFRDRARSIIRNQMLK